MEQTIDLIEINKMEYYKRNIDVHINWLLFLNSFSSITTKGFLTAAPIIESVRSEAYERVNAYNTDTKCINYDVVEVITEILKEKDLSETIGYVGYKLEEKDIINMTAATYVRSHILMNKDNDEEYAYFLDTLRNLRMSHSLNISDYSQELLSYYLESLRIESKKKAKIENYLLMTLTILENLYKAKRSVEERINDQVLIDDLSKNRVVTDITPLTQLFMSNEVELENKESVAKKTLKNN